MNQLTANDFASQPLSVGARSLLVTEAVFLQRLALRASPYPFLFPFRFLHPRLVIPWSAIERCEHVRFWFMQQVAVHVAGFSRRLLFRGGLGNKILEAWAHHESRLTAA